MAIDTDLFLFTFVIPGFIQIQVNCFGPHTGICILKEREATSNPQSMNHQTKLLQYTHGRETKKKKNVRSNLAQIHAYINT